MAIAEDHPKLRGEQPLNVPLLLPPPPWDIPEFQTPKQERGGATAVFPPPPHKSYFKGEGEPGLKVHYPSPGRERQMILRSHLPTPIARSTAGAASRLVWGKGNRASSREKGARARPREGSEKRAK